MARRRTRYAAGNAGLNSRSPSGECRADSSYRRRRRYSPAVGAEELTVVSELGTIGLLLAVELAPSRSGAECFINCTPRVVRRSTSAIR